MLNKILTRLCLIGATLISILSYFLGKKEKENEIIKNNEKKKKEYEKNSFNDISDVIRFLRKK